MVGISRRRFFQAAGAAGAVALWGGGGSPAFAAGTGTTLDGAAVPLGGTGYRRLTAGPGWPLVVRGDLAPPAASRVDHRRPLACFVQFTDMHMVDAQSPARFEYTHPLLGGGAFRAHETLAQHTSAALVRKVNALPGGPFTGRPIDFMMTTGDNTDNHEQVELDWFLTVLNGGRITANTGDPSRYEGVQNSGVPIYWNPDGTATDDYRAKGFPRLPGLLDAAIRPFDSPGLRIPWYCTFGNHDDSVVGTLPDGIPFIDALYTGRTKVMGFPGPDAARVARAMADPAQAADAAAVLAAGRGFARTVTPDARRRPFTTAEFVRAHLDPRNTGPGPVGHGFTPDNADGVDVFYTFRIAPGVTGISLDTTTTAGAADGSIGLHQYLWLEKVLRRNSSRYYDVFGKRQAQSVTDELFILFSHHTSRTMGNVLPDRRRPLDPRLDGNALVALLQRFPNVVAWVNGHTHENRIVPHGTGDRGFWEINTAAHVDHPQHARVIELADNGDGTLSLFTTLVEGDAPYSVDYDDRTPRGLASLAREFAFNDPHADANAVGAPTDRNTELLVPGHSPLRT
ncbi:TIGR03767 family metallophosphoesterase [Saccharothrix australiensis]|uniref:Metallophosphoesterase (TIGR03767 family) n=1 Tax=Saccharothrix australiensis TaxID=2072 RepID=A0A495WCR7_9PSEU|nr:TIGR03767 family metallophosphoesterase [Saccharothrix australiensis]RKT57608.1 metallophosphoesterase (TIGR03767 family) [Saccharothrix australiensis]